MSSDINHLLLWLWKPSSLFLQYLDIVEATYTIDVKALFAPRNLGAWLALCSFLLCLGAKWFTPYTGLNHGHRAIVFLWCFFDSLPASWVPCWSHLTNGWRMFYPSYYFDPYSLIKIYDDLPLIYLYKQGPGTELSRLINWNAGVKLVHHYIEAPTRINGALAIYMQMRLDH